MTSPGKIGIFGGTFDPPHLGHLIIAAEAHAQLKLDRILWVLTPAPPHKQNQRVAPLADRLDMVLAEIGSDPAFELSYVEIDRPGPHYAVDTVRLLSGQYPGAELCYLLGGDSLRDLPLWYHPHEFCDLVNQIGVMHRPGAKFNLDGLEQVIPGIKKKVVFVNSPLLEISSRQIRARIASGRHFRYFLPEKVYQIIQDRRLYQNQKQIGSAST